MKKTFATAAHVCHHGHGRASLRPQLERSGPLGHLDQQIVRDVAPQRLADFRVVGGEARRGLQVPQGHVFYLGGNLDDLEQLGVVGSLPVDPVAVRALAELFEVLPSLGQQAIRNLVREGKSRQMRNMIATGGAEGMQTIEMDLARLVAAGPVRRLGRSQIGVAFGFLEAFDQLRHHTVGKVRTLRANTVDDENREFLLWRTWTSPRFSKWSRPSVAPKHDRRLIRWVFPT